jgi:adenosine deaminase
VSIFTSAFDLAKELSIPVTIHFAEMSSVSREELLTILSWKPKRLGHVIHVPSDIKDEILKQKIGLELCLSCNVHAKMYEGTFGDHHFGEWRERGGLIALSVSFGTSCYALLVTISNMILEVF